MPTPISGHPLSVPAASREGMETCIRFRPSGVANRMFATLFFSACALGFIGLAFFLARDVTVDLSHDTGLCVLTYQYPALGHRRTIIPLKAIHGTGLIISTAKGGRLVYTVTLLTTHGVEKISALTAAQGRQAQKRAIDAFLAQPDAPPLHLLYDQGSGIGLLVAAMALFMAFVLWSLWQEATVRFEWWRRAVVLERRRWPLALWTRAFQLEELAGVRINERSYRRRISYQAVLTLRSGEDVPLLGIWGSGERHYRDVEDRLKAEIRRSHSDQ